MLQEMTRYEMGAVRLNLQMSLQKVHWSYIQLPQWKKRVNLCPCRSGQTEENKLIAGAAGSQMMRNLFEAHPAYVKYGSCP